MTVIGDLSANNSITNSPPLAIFTVAKYLLVVSINNSGAVLYDVDAGIASNTAQAEDDDPLAGCAAGTGASVAAGSVIAGSTAAGSETIGVDTDDENEQASDAISNAVIDIPMI